MLDTLLQDLRYSVRALLHHPSFTAVTLLTLTLGIGANTAIFSVVDGVLLRPAPFSDPSRLMMMWETDRKSGTTREPSAIADYFDFQQRSKQFAQLAAITPTEVNMTHGQTEPRRLAGLAVSHEFIPMVGLKPFLGRSFSQEEDRPGGPRAVIISEDLWAQLFARDPNVLGRAVRLNDVERPVVGVMPREADFGILQVLGAADYGRGFAERGGRLRVDVWMPLSPNPKAPRDNHPILVAGRLASNASAASAQQEMTAIAADLERAYPQSNEARGTYVEPLERVVFGPVQPALYVLLVAVGLVLLVACANVANLLLVRTSDRLREITMRAALGAGMGRLAQQFFVEGALLALLGSSLGVALAYWGLDLLVALAPASLPRIDLVRVDARVLAVTLGASMLVAIGFGALPTLHVRRQDLQRALPAAAGRSMSRGREQKRLRSALIVGQLAMTTMLMVGAGLLIKSLWSLSRVDPGFASAGVLKAEYSLPNSRYPQDFSKFPNWPERTRFHSELMSRLAAVPGVQSVALGGANPLDAGFTSSIRVVGREAEARDWPEPSIRAVSPSYFQTLRVPVTIGRGFQLSDDPMAPPVVVINEAANRRFFDGRNAIGQQINIYGANRAVVGVVGNERIKGLTEPSPPAVYIPTGQAPIASVVMIRTASDPTLIVPVLRRIVRDLDPQLPLFGVETLAETLGNSQAQRRFTMILLVAFAAVALVLAMVGVHGVLSYSVAQRTREIGIRVALGADLNRIRELVLSQGAALVAIGVTAGLGGALLLTQLLSTLLFGVSARDPLTFAGVAMILAVVALVACWLPARRAARVDPIVALRYD